MNPFAEKWAGKECLLDGHRAVIMGRTCPFAFIGIVSGKCSYSIEFAWETVDRIMSKSGHFRSN